MKPTIGLGRGLDTLLAGGVTTQPDRQDKLPVNRLQPGKYQPRTQMDEASLEELAASIRAQGIMQPVLVRMIDATTDQEKYEIIAGERRWRAAQIAGLTEVPVIIREIEDRQALAMSLIENIQRENLNPIEEANGLQRLIDEFKLTHQEAADAIGRSRSAASNLLRLLQLSVPVRELLQTGKLDMGHARALLSLPEETQGQLGDRVVADHLSVRETERLVQAQLNPEQAVQEDDLADTLFDLDFEADPLDTVSTPTNKDSIYSDVTAPVQDQESTLDQQQDADLLLLQEHISDQLGAIVAIRANSKGAGRMTIQFSSLDELDGILAVFGIKEEDVPVLDDVVATVGQQHDSVLEEDKNIFDNIDLQLPSSGSDS